MPSFLIVCVRDQQSLSPGRATVKSSGRVATIPTTPPSAEPSIVACRAEPQASRTPLARLALGEIVGPGEQPHEDRARQEPAEVRPEGDTAPFPPDRGQ